MSKREQNITDKLRPRSLNHCAGYDMQLLTLSLCKSSSNSTRHGRRLQLFGLQTLFLCCFCNMREMFQESMCGVESSKAGDEMRKNLSFESQTKEHGLVGESL